MEKLKNLENILKRYEKVCVAYSGGTDSDFLLNVCKKVLGKNVIAIIGNGAMMAPKDFQAAIELAKNLDVEYYTVEVNIFEVEEFKHNDRRRCYFCKKTIMGGLKKKAQEMGYDVIFDGKNADDGKVYRPGSMAAEEVGIVSPLYEAGFTKKEIRECAKELEIVTWNKPSNSCLATRFPYDTLLTQKDFEMVEKAEKFIDDEKIPSGRVRVHGEIARIEIPKEYFNAFMENAQLIRKIKDVGFRYITLDLEGFRSGSMD